MSTLETPKNLAELLFQAWSNRQTLIHSLHESNTDCYRLFHGTVEGVAGMTVDRYGDALLVQTFHQSLSAQALSVIESFYQKCEGVPAEIYYNDRSLPGSRYNNALPAEMASSAKASRTIHELGVKFVSKIRHRGQDPLLFLDLRVCRRLMYRICEHKTVLNLFAYTCGIGVGAASAGAASVTNVDFAQSSLEYGKQSASLNGLGDHQIEFIEDDFFAVTRQFAGLPLGGRTVRAERHRGAKVVPAGVKKRAPRQFDIVFLDPPRWAKSKYGTVDLIRDYASVFKPALLTVADGGQLICTNNVASVDAAEWIDLLQRSARKAGRPIKTVASLAPDADFPSFDGSPPLKIAVLSF